MKLKTIEIDGLTSECCQAPIYGGQCMKCGNEAKGERLIIKGVYMETKPWYRALGQSLKVWWPVLIGGLVGLFVGYQLVSYCGK